MVGRMPPKGKYRVIGVDTFEGPFADWSFRGLRGYLNIEPELETKVKKWADRHADCVSCGTGKPNVAAADAIARLSA